MWFVISNVNLATYKELNKAVLDHFSQEWVEGTEVSAGVVSAREAWYFFEAFEFKSKFIAISG